MSEILNSFVVEQNNLQFTPSTNNVNITPEAVQLNIFTGAAPVAGGPNTSVQYSNGGVLEGSADFVFDISNNTVIANLLEVTTQANLGDPSNVIISGGINGYVLQTDGTGNLSWTAQTGAGGNGVPGGSNTQIQYNDGGLFGGTVGFTFDKSTGDVEIPGNLDVTGGIIGTLSTANQPNITNVGTLTSLDVSGTANINSINANAIAVQGNVNANGTVSALFFSGNGNPLFGINAANIVGTVANANFATNAGTVTTNAQPNITSVGTLTSLTVSGNASAGNLSTAGNLSVSSTTSIFEAIENVSLIGAQSGTYNYDVLNGAIQYSTANATANVTLNFRGNSTTTLNSVLANGKSTTVTYVMTTGTTPYSVNAVEIDTTAQSIKWVNGIIPPLNSSSITSYTFTLIKTSTAPTYTVLGSATRYA